MDTFEAFENDLRAGLVHLHDPAFQPAARLWQLIDRSPQDGGNRFRETLIREIERLKPAPEVPRHAPARRIYDVLFYRYLQGLTQEDVAHRLGMHPRTVRRVQQQAITALAQRLWARGRQTSTPDEPVGPPEKLAPSSGPGIQARRHQMTEELLALRQNAPGIVADVGATLHKATALTGVLAANHGLSITMTADQTDLLAAIHPLVLRQIVIRAIELLVRQVVGPEIRLWAGRAEEQVLVTIAGQAAPTAQIPHSSFITEALRMTADSSGDPYLADGELGFEFRLAPAKKMTIFVVEDNPDVVHFYQRYVEGTRYQIVHLTETDRLVERIAETAPAIIILDILFPDLDGWELLTQLRQNPQTQGIPIIVCSVIRGEDMAAALGATRYLPKPPRPRQFLQALDDALNQIEAAT